MNKNKLVNRLIIIVFISVPLLSSLISMIHLFNMYDLGNIEILAIASAICIELGAISSFLSLSILSKLNRTIVWSIFILLFLLQIIGNIYYSFDYITIKMTTNSTYLNSFQELMNRFFTDIELPDVKLILSIIIGAPIPIISLMLLKSLMDYIKPSKNTDENNNELNDENIIEKKLIQNIENENDNIEEKINNNINSDQNIIKNANKNIKKNEE